jgi:crotonobetainyl-CoA:carnitine CoA-transferase CaiB-like acyl-CoA transferase
MSGPLSGVRVIEVANFITGPYAGQLLADLGADVVKVEDPRGGDPFRAWGKGQYSPHFVAHNRGKRSIALDLKQPSALRVFERLIARADVLIENFRPGVADRLGIGYARARELNPRLIYCSISGMGQAGPYVHRPSYDTVGQGLSGLLSQLLDPAAPQPIGPAFSDALTGIFACYGVLGALYARSATGRGQRVETSMLEATMGFQVEPYARYFATGEVPNPYSRPRQAQVYAFTCADGLSFAVHLSSPPKFWEGLCRVAGREDLIGDPRFADRDARVEQYDFIQQTLTPIFKTRPRAEWLRLLEAADVPHTPIYTLDQVLQDPQVQHLGMVQTAEHPSEGTVRMVNYPVHLSETRLENPSAPPTLGEHTDAVLAELGFDAHEAARLRSEGAFGA